MRRLARPLRDRGQRRRTRGRRRRDRAPDRRPGAAPARRVRVQCRGPCRVRAPRRDIRVGRRVARRPPARERRRLVHGADRRWRTRSEGWPAAITGSAVADGPAGAATGRLRGLVHRALHDASVVWSSGWDSSSRPAEGTRRPGIDSSGSVRVDSPLMFVILFLIRPDRSTSSRRSTTRSGSARTFGHSSGRRCRRRRSVGRRRRPLLGAVGRLALSDGGRDRSAAAQVVRSLPSSRPSPGWRVAALGAVVQRTAPGGRAGRVRFRRGACPGRDRHRHPAARPVRHRSADQPVPCVRDRHGRACRCVRLAALSPWRRPQLVRRGEHIAVAGSTLLVLACSARSAVGHRRPSTAASIGPATTRR